jgi:hypothetical protein
MKPWIPRLVLQFAILAAMILLLASSGSAYYYYVHYPSANGPFTPIFERFDLNALANKTVYYFVSDQAPSPMVAGDSYQAVLGEIRAASQVWNNVSTSALRLGYGGVFTVGTNETSPGIDVVFSQEIPPGLWALSGPSVRGSVTQGPNGPFVPIVRSKMMLSANMVGTTGASWTEAFFTTVVHEFGHTLGLQHTLTSAVMSTIVTSAATHATPLAQDDITAISLLYPTGAFAGSTGSISGTVTANGVGVNLASVVAISPSNQAISALTNPDGSYTIDGIPPGQYYVYAHPLPPSLMGESYPANVYPPLDNNGNAIPAGPSFTSQFYPGTRDWTQAQAVFVYQGNVTSQVSFSVTPRNAPAISSVRTYGYSSTSVPETSPPLLDGVPATIVATGNTGLLQNGNITPGLTVGMLGTPAQIYGVQPYYQQYLAFDVMVGNVTGPGPKHLLFETPDDMYVLPSGFTVVVNQPPSITSVTPSYDNNGNRVVLVSGSNFSSDTRIVFNGLAGNVEGTTPDGRLIVQPPQGPGSSVAAVVALNDDGQSSLFLQGSYPTTYTYDPASTPSLSVTPQYLLPGTQTLVDVYGQNTNFDSQVSVGFGTSDVQVSNITVLSPTHLQVTATSLLSAPLLTTRVNVTDGLNVIAQSLGFPVQFQQPSH